MSRKTVPATNTSTGSAGCRGSGAGFAGRTSRGAVCALRSGRGKVVPVRLAIVGGGGFRVPLVYRALLADEHDDRVTDVVLHDTDQGRLRAVGRVLEALGAGVTGAP